MRHLAKNDMTKNSLLILEESVPIAHLRSDKVVHKNSLGLLS